MADELSGGAKCVKYILFLFNLLFLLGGLALIIVGALIQVHTNANHFASWTSGAGIYIIVIGAIVFIVSFFGCAGAINNNYCMVMTYAVLLILLLLAEVAGLIAAFVLKDKLKDHVLTDMKAYMNTAYDPNTPQNMSTSTLAWDETQKELNCCGIENSTSWQNNTFLQQTQSLPDSCCISPSPGCGKDKLQTKDDKDIKPKGCYDALVDHLKTYLVAVGAVAASVALIELIGIVFACCLGSQLRKDYRVV